jgi:hypothetical protein
MANSQKLDTHHKALTLNLDPSTFGSFAEIGAGQEIARWFLVAGGASGTIAKTISAYDKEVSDELYGSGSRYVSKQRLEAMLDKEWADLQTQLGNIQMLAAGVQELRQELGEAVATPIGIFCLTAASLTPGSPPLGIPDLLQRIDALLTGGGDVLLFRERELYAMTGLVNRYTQAPLRFVIGLSLLIRAFNDPYGNLEGRRFEALARLFAQNVRIYAYPMSAADLREWIENNSGAGWEWRETNGQVSAKQLRNEPPLGHLYEYLLASNFLVSMQIPARATTDQQNGR